MDDHDTKVMSGRQDLDATVHIPTLQPGEPFFLIRAQDQASEHAVRHWIYKAHALGVDTAVLEQAFRQVDRIAAWPNKKLPDTGHIPEGQLPQLRYQFRRRAYNAIPPDDETEAEVMAFQRGYDLAMARSRPARQVSDPEARNRLMAEIRGCSDLKEVCNALGISDEGPQAYAIELVWDAMQERLNELQP